MDADPGGGDPEQGDPQGQANLYLFWETGDVVDRPDAWEMTLGLVDKAPEDQCTVDVTPRRLQRLSPEPGRRLRWTNTALSTNRQIQAGDVKVDPQGLITLEGVRVGKGRNRIRVF